MVAPCPLAHDLSENAMVGKPCSIGNRPLLPGTREVPTFLIPGTPLQSDAHSGLHGGEPPCYELLKLGSGYTPFTTKSRTEDGWVSSILLYRPSPSSFEGVVEGVEVVEANP